MRAPIVPRRRPQHLLSENRLAPPRKWPKLVGLLAVVAGLVGGLAAGLGTGCVIPDLEYCDSNVKCAAQNDGTQMVCNTLRHTCVPATPNGCTENTDCKDPARPRCDRLSMACTPCRTDDAMSCSSISPSARCTELEGGETRCVECGKNLDCKDPARPICDLSTNQCRSCQRHSDCEGTLTCDTGAPCTDSLVCIKDGDLAEPGLAGRCALNEAGMFGRVIYMASPDPDAGNSITVCTEWDKRDGRTPDRAVCRLPTALANAKSSNLHYIRLIGDYDFSVGQTILTKEGPYHMIGAPRTGGTKNRGFIAASKFLEIRESVVVTLDQVDVMAKGADTNPLYCDGRNAQTTDEASWLRIFGSTITGLTTPSSFIAGRAAVVTDTCNLLIDRSVIGVTKLADASSPSAGAHSIGVNILDRTATGYARTTVIQNSLIAGNIQWGIYFTGVLENSTKVRVQFNTIYGNGRKGNKAGAISCPFMAMNPPTGKQFLNNVIFNNQLDATVMPSTQFGDPTFCGFFNNVVDKRELSNAPGLTTSAVEFDENLRIVAGNGSNASCIDKAMPYAMEAIPAYDLDGNPRPQPTGGAADVGATEVKK